MPEQQPPKKEKKRKEEKWKGAFWAFPQVPQPPIQTESDQTVLVQCVKKASKHKRIEKLKA